MFYGAFVIGLADNTIRPILVGQDTKNTELHRIDDVRAQRLCHRACDRGDVHRVLEHLYRHPA
jgi:hypothetical protein